MNLVSKAKRKSASLGNITQTFQRSRTAKINSMIMAQFASHVVYRKLINPSLLQKQKKNVG